MPRLDITNSNYDDIELGDVIGHGSFGVVFRAHYRPKTAAGRGGALVEVAVKQLLLSKGDEERTQRDILDFKTEVQVMAALHHPFEPEPLCNGWH